MLHSDSVIRLTGEPAERMNELPHEECRVLRRVRSALGTTGRSGGRDRGIRRRASVRTLASEAWALRHNVTIGDALYVVMARHLHATLITLDVRLANAPTLGVTTRVP